MLEIQTEAVAQINLRLDSGLLAQVHLDYIRPGYSRTLEIVGAKGVLSWDYSRGEVCLGLPDGSVRIVHKTPINFNRNSMFLVCMAHFLHRIVEVDTPALSSFQDGLSALRVALSCHQSMFERRNIRPDEVDSSFELMEIF
jgi:predicted dehydrogenase